MVSGATTRQVSPLRFGATLSGPPLISSERGYWHGALIRYWRAVAPEIAQPPLEHHYVTLHMGGGKRIQRRGEGGVQDAVIEAGALSIVPAGAGYRWTTDGPIEFVHVYLAPEALREAGAFDSDGGGLADRFGIRDPLLEALMLAMLDEVTAERAGSRVYLDTLLQALTLRLRSAHGSRPRPLRAARHVLAPARLRRVREFVEANLATDIGLADLAAVAASSPWHFSRTFAQATGHAPYTYLIRRRIDHAKALLADGDEPVAIIARACGFQSAGQFARMFRRLTGCSPREFRRDRSI